MKARVMKTMLKASLALVTVAVLYVLLWPTGMEPAAWTAPPPPDADGVYAPNDKLKGIQRLAEGVGRGPEGVNVDAVGRIYAGYADGRVITLSADAATYTEMADTEGRPLGITFGPNGGLVIADAKKGLLQLGMDVRLLVTAVDGARLGLVNDADNTRLDKNVYFTESSRKFASSTRDLLEHGANGRLLQYNVATKQTRVLLDHLHFPNGVAVGPEDAYVLVAETGEYRVLRYWLKGEKAGTHEVFIDNLPGFPDNISYDDRDKFWLALAAPRSSRLDELLSGHLFLRQVLGRLGSLPRILAQRRAWVLALGLDGQVIGSFQADGDDAFAPISSVREHGPWLYFGSPREKAIGRMPLQQLLPGAAPAPPTGWETLPALKRLEPPKDREEEEEERRERAHEG